MRAALRSSSVGGCQAGDTAMGIRDGRDTSQRLVERMGQSTAIQPLQRQMQRVARTTRLMSIKRGGSLVT